VIVFNDGRINRDEPVAQTRSAREELERLPEIVDDELEEED
jgi:hypothetical protein